MIKQYFVYMFALSISPQEVNDNVFLNKIKTNFTTRAINICIVRVKTNT